jgi:prenyltransferase beta subunit
LWERLSGIIFRLAASPYLGAFEKKSPEIVLRQSLNLLDPETLDILREYVKNRQTQSGGFEDKAGRPDLYYSLFGYYLADALDLDELLPAIGKFAGEKIKVNSLDEVHLHCAAILASKLCRETFPLSELRKMIRLSFGSGLKKGQGYSAFINLLACYYIRDYKSLFVIKKGLDELNGNDSLPSPVIAALLVLQRSFNRPVNDLQEKLLSFYRSNGGFSATLPAPVADLLSTAVALYALNFSGYDLRRIKPDSLNFIDLHFRDGGFGGNLIDSDPDTEYTFYGLLALGSLAD